MKNVDSSQELRHLLGKTDMYIIDLIQKGYFDKPLSVLDAGCGSGRNLFLLARLGHKIVGVDKDEEVVLQLKNHINDMPEISQAIDVRVGELDHLPFSNCEFDVVVCNAVLHFARDIENFERMLTELKRVVVNKGVIFLRLVTSHTMVKKESQFNKTMMIADGTNRFVVDHFWLKNILKTKLDLEFLEEFKTVNVDDKRTMTTLVLGAK